MTRTTTLLTVFVALLLGLQYALWFGNGNLIETLRLDRAIDVQKQENQRLVERNRTLEAEVVDLKNGREAVEERARSELGMIKPGETFFQIVEPDAD